MTQTINIFQVIKNRSKIIDGQQKAIAQYFIDTNNNSTTQNLSDTIKSLESATENKC